MALVLVVHYHLHPGKASVFEEYEAQTLEIFRRHGGEILAAFAPAKRGSENVPDKIHVLRIHSAKAYGTFQNDPAQQRLDQNQLRANAIRDIHIFCPESLDGFGSGLETVVSGKRLSVELHMRSLVQGWEAAADRRVIFLQTYLMVTSSMLGALYRGEFDDKVWVRELLERFAGYYFLALEKYEQGWFLPPPVWLATFKAAKDPGTLTVQHLLLGVNAHINHDLVFTLVDMLEPEWARLTPAKLQERYRDHTHVNEVIAHTLDAVKDQIIAKYSPIMDALAPAYKGIDNWVISKMVVRWRGQVWNNALAYLKAKNNDEKDRIRQKVEYITLRRADAILFKRGRSKMSALG